MNGDSESVLSAIDAAFPRLPFSREFDDRLRDVDISLEGRDASQLLIGKAWHEIDCRDFECNYPSPFMIEPVALQYYFPGFLQCAVRDPDSRLALSLFASQLLPPKNPQKLAEFSYRYAWMTGGQKQAVAAFLTYFRGNVLPRNERRRRQIDGAIERFWGNDA